MKITKTKLVVGQEYKVRKLTDYHWHWKLSEKTLTCISCKRNEDGARFSYVNDRGNVAECYVDTPNIAYIFNEKKPRSTAVSLFFK